MDGLGWSTFEVVHIVVRGTYLPGTVRCTSGNSFRVPSHLELSSDEPPDILIDLLQIYCYADVRVNAYIVGTGPSVLTAIVAFDNYGFHGISGIRTGRGRDVASNLGACSDRGRRAVAPTACSTGPSGGITGREAILFLGPSSSASVEAWQVYEKWDIQRREDDTAVAVHPDVFFYQHQRPDSYESLLSQLELTLPAFEQAATTAHQARVTANGGRVRPDPAYPMLVNDASQHSTYFREVGAYSDPASPPAQPPPVLTCANGTAVTGPNTNWGLVQDCEALLVAKDTLRGTATLNWSKDLAIGSWDGITTSGTPSRVTELDLSNESLSGTIPAELGTLFELTTLDLRSNSLTGSIPRELGWLFNLEELRLSGNSLTGCIPVTLQDVATNDLSSLNLLYCAPPAPENLSAGTTTQTSVALNWDAVANTSRYRMEYRRSLTRDWTTDTETLTTTSHTVNELLCYKGYQFRVSAYGSGTTYAAAWSEPSTTLSEITGECTAPVFDEESYSFTVMEDAGTGAEVDTVSATDPNDDAVTYAITAGNAAGTFAIGPSTGTITVAGPLNRTTMPLHTLTVEADDGNGNTDSVTVEITVTQGATCSDGTAVPNPTSDSTRRHRRVLPPPACKQRPWELHLAVGAILRFRRVSLLSN